MSRRDSVENSQVGRPADTLIRCAYVDRRGAKVLSHRRLWQDGVTSGPIRYGNRKGWNPRHGLASGGVYSRPCNSCRPRIGVSAAGRWSPVVRGSVGRWVSGSVSRRAHGPPDRGIDGAAGLEQWHAAGTRTTMCGSPRTGEGTG